MLLSTLLSGWDNYPYLFWSTDKFPVIFKSQFKSTFSVEIFPDILSRLRDSFSLDISPLY